MSPEEFAKRLRVMYEGISDLVAATHSPGEKSGRSFEPPWKSSG
jgi:hypothetical protein